MSQELEAVKAAVTQMASTVDAAVAKLAGVAAQMAEQTADKAALQQIAADLQAKSAELSAAMTA